MGVFDDSGQVISPPATISVCLCLHWLGGQAVASQIVGNQTMVLKLGIKQLLVPVQPAAKQSMNKDDGGAVWIASLLHSQHDAIGCGDGVVLGIGTRGG